MADRLTHRGPDDSGEWTDDEAGIALAFRRLSIIDLSPTGHQPMLSPSGRYVIAYNGEVYNFRRLHHELGAPPLSGHSDTEVILLAIERWGLRPAVERFVGMFAFAVWDREERTLHLVRDRIGVKPLHYAYVPGGVIFASELKALAAHPLFDDAIDRSALALYTRLGYIPAPHTIYASARKLMPGTIFSISDPEQLGEPETFWSARDAALHGHSAPFRGTDGEAAEELRALLDDAIALRRIADVPVGVFLSSGVDSSTVAGIMSRQAAGGVRTFTIASGDPATDESADAAAIAKHLGTIHAELRVTGADALAIVPQLPQIFDEPFADSSAVPTVLVSRLARPHVTVALSGDGGDELFGGYPRYVLKKDAWGIAARLPHIARRSLGAVLAAAGQSERMRHLERRSAIAARLRLSARGARFGPAMSRHDDDAIYLETLTQWTDVVLEAGEALDPFRGARRAPLRTHAERAMFIDLMTYLPDDLLAKVDRASMSASLEVREPLLDHRIVEFALRLPLRMKIRNGETKWLLRQVMAQHVPPQLVSRRKLGFTVPLGEWLRGPLRDWAEELLREDRLRSEGFFDVGSVRARWSEHVTGVRGWDNHLWTILMFQAWLRD